jgi:hypothetical protein
MKKITLAFTEISIVRVTLKSKDPQAHEVFFPEKPYTIGKVDREDYERYDYSRYKNFRAKLKINKNYIVSFKEILKLKFLSEYRLVSDFIPYLKVLFIHANKNHATQLHRLLLTNIDLAFKPDNYWVSPFEYVGSSEYDSIKTLFPYENLDLLDQNAEDRDSSNLRCYIFYCGLLSQILFENIRWSSFLPNLLLDHPHYLG